MKKNRFLAGLLCATLILTLLPGATMATPATEIAIGGVPYYSDDANPAAGWSLTFGTKPCLTLDGYTGGDVYADGDLTIILNGVNTVTATDAFAPTGVACNGNLSISGGGTLVTTGINGGYGLESQGNLSMQNVTVEATGGANGWGIAVNGNLAITGATVTAVGLSARGDAVISGSRVTANANEHEALSVGNDLTVTDASAVNARSEKTEAVICGAVTVSGAGSKLRGVNTANGMAIASRTAINGPVTEPVGGVVGIDPVTRNYTVLNAPGGTPVSAATLSIPAVPINPDAGGDTGATADVPRTGDGTPLLGIALLCGAGLAVRRKRTEKTR